MKKRADGLHDIKNTVTVIQWHVRKLQEPNPESRSSALSSLCASLTKLENQLEALTRVSQASPSALGANDLFAFIHDHHVPLLARMHELDIAVRCQAGPLCRVLATHEFIAAVLDNLIANSATACAARVGVTLREHDHMMTLTVEDDGRGMSEDEIDHLGLGHSSKQSPGHGHGFALVRSLTAELQGYVRRPESKLGVGTRIEIVLRKCGPDPDAT